MTLPDENPYAVGETVQQEQPRPAASPPRTSSDLLIFGDGVRCKARAVLPALCVLQGTAVDLVVVRRRLTRQFLIVRWGPCVFLTQPWSGLGILALIWALAHRFLGPEFAKSCDVTYFIERDRLNTRRSLGHCSLAVAVASFVVTSMLSTALHREQGLMYGGSFVAISLMLADYFYSGPVRLFRFGFGSRYVLKGFSKKYLVEAKKMIVAARPD